MSNNCQLTMGAFNAKIPCRQLIIEMLETRGRQSQPNRVVALQRIES